jgi:large subunit ribosomal protein L18
MNRLQRTLKRRRHEQKTDYGARMGMLKSANPRIVVRKTNRYVVAQIVQSLGAQDRVIAQATSLELIEKGWPKALSGSLKSLPAAYLTGLLLAQKTGQEKSFIFDIGMQRNIKKGRLYAVLKGLIDSGITIPHGKDVLPDDKHLERNSKTREAYLKLKGALMTHGRKGNKE